MDEVAGEPVRVSYIDAVKCRHSRLVAQAVEAGPAQACPAVAVVAEDEAIGELLPQSGQVRPQSLNLLVDGLGLALALRRDADVDGDGHRTPPGKVGVPRRRAEGRDHPRPGEAGKPGPSGADRRGGDGASGASASGAS